MKKFKLTVKDILVTYNPLFIVINGKYAKEEITDTIVFVNKKNNVFLPKLLYTF